MSMIAIIEDNLSNMKLIEKIITSAGYKTLCAETADKGIPLIREHLPALILMDIQMPGTDGIVATRILKADPLTKHIPVIALTARAMVGDSESILAAGFDGYASKPYRYKDVLQLIGKFIGNSD